MNTPNPPSSPNPFAHTPPEGPASHAAAAPDEHKTEQEKDTSGAVHGVGPANASEASPGPVETMEDLGIGPRDPYPEGSPPPPSDEDLANIEATKKEAAAKPAPKKEAPVHPEPHKELR